jgi:ubiquinone/menaquinone biosynthesis C-methylase UbiE
MGRKLTEQQFNNPAAWETAYAKQGRLWGGVPAIIPDLPDHSRVLELGCGNGKLLAFLAENLHECIGLDFSENACRLSQRNVKSPNVNLIIADARQIPLRSGSVDTVIAFHVVGHLLAEDRTALVAESARVLSSGGKFLFCDFSIEDFRAGNGEEIEDRTYRRGTGIITHYFTDDEIRALSGHLSIDMMRTIRRSMKIRGTVYPRAEIMATFVRC